MFGPLKGFVLSLTLIAYSKGLRSVHVADATWPSDLVWRLECQNSSHLDSTPMQNVCNQSLWTHQDAIVYAATAVQRSCWEAGGLYL